MGENVEIYLRLKPVRAPSPCVSIDVSENQCVFDIPRDDLAGYVNNQREKYAFQFNGVLAPDAQQDEVFERCAAKVVTGALDGFNGTVFAYGQTGSGKTFTITGGVERYADRGIIPRAISRLYADIAKKTDGKYEVHVSYMEIYQDQGYDLLDPEHDTKALEDLPRVSVREDDAGDFHLQNLSTHRCESEEDALNLLFLGDTNRAITETPMNMASTRSHCIFTMQVERREVGSEIVRRAKVNLVDLAGSERVKKTDVSGKTLAEAKYINLSLHYLEAVVIALQERAMGGGRGHIPYRNGLMTMMLKDSLGGNCKTVMLATASPDHDSVDESISTCRFAQRIAMVANVVTINEDIDPALVIKRLKRENQELRDEIKLLSGVNDDRGALTESEIERLRSRVKAYVDGGGADEGEGLAADIGASMMKIKASYEIFREMVLRRGGGGVAGVAAGGGEASTSPRSPPSPVVEPPGAFDDLREELRLMRERVRQRDAEINVLVGMLQRGEGGTRGGYRATAAVPLVDASNPSSTLRAIVGENENGNENDAASALPPADVLADRDRAFEHFKRAYAQNAGVERDKSTLRELYAKAKTLGERVNAARDEINAQKSKIEKRRVARALKTLSDADFDPECDAVDQAEERAKATIEESKCEYRTAFDELRDVKKEIDRLQLALDQSRRRLTTDFEKWLVMALGQQNGDGGPEETILTPGAARSLGQTVVRPPGSAGPVARYRPLSAAEAEAADAAEAAAGAAAPTPAAKTSAATPAPVAKAQTREPMTELPMTGNAQVDADIAKFFAAKNLLMKRAEKA
jgi:kinesin family member 6/9